MTTVELLAYCSAHKHQPCIPDLVWQGQMHRDENLGVLCNDYDDAAPNGFHDMYDSILETRDWLVTIDRTYPTVLFTEGAGCNKQQK